MLTRLNTKSLYLGTDMKRFNELRDLLDRNGISYIHKVHNRMGQWAGRGTLRGQMGSIGCPSDTMYEYEILVDRKEYEQARYLMGRK